MNGGKRLNITGSHSPVAGTLAGAFKTTVSRVKDASGYLSEHHDLAMLSEKVLTLNVEGADRTAAETLAALSWQRQKELEACARMVGERVYAEEPAAFTRRFKEYWRSWRTAAASEDSTQESEA